MRKYKEYSDQDIIFHASNVKSIRALLTALGLRPAGGNYIHCKKQLQRLSVDTSHWTGQAWSKEQQMKDFSRYKRASNLKKHLLKERSHKCENCSLEKWLDQPIMLEIDHIDGDRTNNNINNLKLLCPNCHAQTKTWRNRKRN